MKYREFVKLAMSDDYQFKDKDFIDFPFMRRDPDVMKKAIRQNVDFAKYIMDSVSFSYGDKTYELAIQLGFNPTLTDFVNFPELRRIKVFANLLKNLIKNKLSDILDKNYMITEQEMHDFSLVFSDINFAFGLSQLKNDFFVTTIKQNNRFIKYLNVDSSSATLEQNICYELIQNGFIPKEEDFLANKSLGYLYCLMDKMIDINPDYIKYIKLGELSSTVINSNMSFKNEQLYQKAIRKGYIPNKKDFLDNFVLTKSPTLLKKALEIDLDLFDCCHCDDEALMQLAIDFGYVPSIGVITNNKVIASSTVMMERAITINPSSVEFSPKALELWNIAIEHGYKPNFLELKENRIFCKTINDEDNKWYADSVIYYLLHNTEELCNNKFLAEYIKQNDCKSILINFQNLCLMWDFISNEKIYSYFTYNEILFIVKHVYCSNNANVLSLNDTSLNIKDKLNIIIMEDKFNTLITILKILIGDETKDIKIKLKLTEKIIQKFYYYYDFCKLFIESNYTNSDIFVLYKILTNDDETFELNNMDDLRKISKELYIQNNNIINDDNTDIVDYYNIILSMLLNINYARFNEIISNGFSSDAINNLAGKIKNEKAKRELSKYKALIALIEKIVSIKDLAIIKGIANKINNSIYLDQYNICDIYGIFIDFDSIKKYYYGLEIQEKMLDLNNMQETPKEILNDSKVLAQQPYIRQNAKFKCPYLEYIKDIIDDNPAEAIDFGNILNNPYVDYIEIKDMDFNFFVHVLNAYGTGASLYEFNNPRFNGKSFICVAAINNTNYNLLPEERNDKELFQSENGYSDADIDNDVYLQFANAYGNKENVKLVFTKMQPSQLAYMGNHDLSSFGDVNSLDIILKYDENYLPFNDNISSSLSLNQSKYNYCEYGFYREDSNGNYIYPSAVLSMGDEPTASEIMAAAQLNIPIIHIKKVLNKNMSQEQSVQIENEDFRQAMDQLKQFLANELDNTSKLDDEVGEKSL